ncbi:hypothetical protein FNH06_24870 [Amycolatopsis acidiphila]|uniref:D-isomer specific 2-hydroxyacid dehydrogenase NAD-binding domain-containing protein n=2 Tax=Amycolatopsis acidiphila TaxID=715473 RepID=A0A558A4V2_9PSEU|nr:hypothetical protein FNH06_24870 [Amycolatopsis acidiphila]
MIGAAELRAMKPSALLVNVGRGPLCDEQTLYEVCGTARSRPPRSTSGEGQARENLVVRG